MFRTIGYFILLFPFLPKEKKIEEQGKERFRNRTTEINAVESANGRQSSKDLPSV